MRIRWTPAAADLQNLSDYLKEHRPHYRPCVKCMLLSDLGEANGSWRERLDAAVAVSEP